MQAARDTEPSSGKRNLLPWGPGSASSAGLPRPSSLPRPQEADEEKGGKPQESWLRPQGGKPLFGEAAQGRRLRSGSSAPAAEARPERGFCRIAQARAHRLSPAPVEACGFCSWQVSGTPLGLLGSKSTRCKRQHGIIASSYPTGSCLPGTPPPESPSTPLSDQTLSG